MEKKPAILIVDDERNTREGLKLALEEHYEIYLAGSGLQGLEILRAHPVDIVLTDLRMPGMDGMDFLRQINVQKNPPLVILLTAYGSVQTSLEAMSAGAYDYVSKPVDIDALEAIIMRGLATRTEEDAPSSSENFQGTLIAESPAMRAVVESLRQIADTRATVLITGESGTGKEVVAHALHAFSQRAGRPFVAVHCAALNENLLESELFGHEKGAYTGASSRKEGRFELAENGTIFLDEIGEISLATQVKLLRVLENRAYERVGGTETLEMKARLVVATNRNLSEMVANGTFREDLFYRLNVVTISIPPLRNRREDIVPLLDFFLKKASRENDREISGFSPDAVKLLEIYDWPGNVREVRNCVERMVVFARGTMLTMSDIPKDILIAVGRQFSPEPASAQTEKGDDMPPRQEIPDTQPMASAFPSSLDVHEQERKLILSALDACGGNRSHAAEKLGISRRTLQRKLHEFGIQ